MHKVAIVGAGKTGRGFLARLAAESAQSIIFIDTNSDLVQSLNTAGSFKIDFFGDVREPVIVSNYHACTWESADLTGLELIFVAVGGENLQSAGESLSRALPADSRACVIACENASSAADKLSAALNRPEIPVSEATVFCTTIENGALDIASEDYPYLQCDAARLRSTEICVSAVKPVDRFGNFLTRKLYTYNAASCVISYLGALRGHSDYAEAANDPVILPLLDRNYAQTNIAMCAEFGYAPDDQAEFALLSRKKFTSRAIKDTIERNARDVARKLAPGERIIGVINLMRKHNANSSIMEMTAAAALLYTADPKWEQRKSECDFRELLTGFCAITDAALVDRIIEYADRLASGNFAPMESRRTHA